MNILFHTPFLVILIPMITAVLIALLQKPKLTRGLMICSQLIAIVLTFGLLLQCLKSPDQSYVYVMGEFPAPWGNELRAGLLEAIFAFAFAIVMFGSCLGGSDELKDDFAAEKVYTYFLMLSLLNASMNALIFTNDIFTAYVFIEINTIAACAIVVAKESGATLRATMKYLLMSILGSGLFLLATSILYSVTGQLLMESANGQIIKLVKTGLYNVPILTSIVLYSVAIGVKSALFPFHTWLPDAHGSATTISSAVLSSLVLKGYIILLIKIMFRVYGFDTIVNLGILPVLFVLGICGMIMGSVMAFKQKDLKRMIAYSSVAQIGYIFMGIGMGTEFGIVAACYHILAHAFTKSMLFIAAGKLVKVSGSKKIADLSGAANLRPVAGIAFVVGSLSMIGVPLFAGFVSKFYLGLGALQVGPKGIIALVALAVSTFLNAIYYLPVVMKIYSKTEKGLSPKDDKKVAEKTFIPSNIVLMGMILINLFLGIGYSPILKAIEVGLKAFA